LLSLRPNTPSSLFPKAYTSLSLLKIKVYSFPQAALIPFILLFKIEILVGFVIILFILSLFDKPH
jgi:hypothetical protein